jgi:DNA-binding SARP family transcriptional activator
MEVYSEPGRSASHERLAAQVAARKPRLLTVWAPAGYDKHAFVRMYGARVGTVLTCDLDRRRDRDLARPVLDAVVTRDRSRATRSAANRLAQRRDLTFGTAREALRREWPRADGPEVLLLRDATEALSTPAGADLLAELIATLPAERTIAIATRKPLPHGLEQLVRREAAESVEPRDLALSVDAVRETAREAGLTNDVADSVHALTEGWPLLSRLLLVLAKHNDAAALLREMAELPRHALLGYASLRVVTALPEAVREAVVAASVRPGATASQLVRVLGDRCDHAVLFHLWTLPFVTVDDERTFIHPDLSAMLRSRFTPLVDAVYERTISALLDDGEPVAAARVALANRDADRAAALLDSATPYTTGAIALSDYERVLDRIDHRTVTRYPNLWTATIAFRRFAVDRETYVREAETVYFCLPYSTPPLKRAAALTHLASAYFSLGRAAECDSLFEASLDGFASEPGPARAVILNCMASVRGERGRFTEARALARQAAELTQVPFGESLALHHIDAAEAAVRGWYGRLRVIYDELLRRHSEDELPLYFAYCATDAAISAWLYGDDAGFAHYISVLESALTAGLEAGFATMIDAAHGRAVPADDGYAWPVHSAMAQLYRFGSATTPAEAVAAAHAAAAAATLRGDVVLRAFSHVALFLLDERSREPSRAALKALVSEVESPELSASVEGVLSGRDAGIFSSFITRRVHRSQLQQAPRLSVELLTGRVVRDGAAVKISGKELELLALLASAYCPLSADRIGEALWDDLDPSRWPNNLKVTLSRLRKKLGVREAVLSGEGYRLSRAVDVDLRRYETALRASAGRSLDDDDRAALARALESYVNGSAAQYDRFPRMQPLVARIEDLVCAAGLALAEDALRRGRHEDALRYAGIVIAVDPYNEHAAELTIRLQLRLGDRDAARREYHRYSAALAAELGAEPSPRLAQILGIPAKVH